MMRLADLRYIRVMNEEDVVFADAFIKRYWGNTRKVDITDLIEERKLSDRAYAQSRVDLLVAYEFFSLGPHPSTEVIFGFGVHDRISAHFSLTSKGYDASRSSVSEALEREKVAKRKDDELHGYARESAEAAMRSAAAAVKANELARHGNYIAWAALAVAIIAAVISYLAYKANV